MLESLANKGDGSYVYLDSVAEAVAATRLTYSSRSFVRA